MNNDFIEVAVYSNQTSLKRYLSESGIVYVQNDDAKNYSLSDNGYGGILAFNKDISINDVELKCCNDTFETAVVIKLLLNKKTKVVAYYDNGKQSEGELGKFRDAIAYLVKSQISFCNVISIIPVERELVFLQGDSTIKIPEQLIKKDFYCPVDCISSEALNVILSNINTDTSFNDNLSGYYDDMDDFEITSIELSSINDKEITINNASNLRNKLLAGLLMLIQGNNPIQNKLTADIYSILEDGNSFENYIKEHIYVNIPFDISQYIEKPNETIVRFYYELKRFVYNEPHQNTLFSSVIYALLNLENDDKEQFKTLFLDKIHDQILKRHAEECLNDLRARNRITLLIQANDDMLPVYALYAFFDYGFDRLNENIIEFGLNGSAFVPVLLSLWALKNGMNCIYEEFKNPEIIYACDMKISHWLGGENDIIPIDVFLTSNKIKVKNDEIIVGNFRCSYINIAIEYNYCVGKTVEQIEKLIDKLEKAFVGTFSFQYNDFKQAIRKHRETNMEFRIYADSIHKKYLSLIKEGIPKKNKTHRKSKSQLKPVEVENFTLFNYLNKEDKKDE